MEIDDNNSTFQDLVVVGSKQFIHDDIIIAQNIDSMLIPWSKDQMIDRFDVRHMCDTPAIVASLIPNSKAMELHDHLVSDRYFDSELIQELQFERYSDYERLLAEAKAKRKAAIEFSASNAENPRNAWNQSGYISTRQEIWTRPSNTASLANSSSEDCNVNATGSIELSSKTPEVNTESLIEVPDASDYETPIWYQRLQQEPNTDSDTNPFTLPFKEKQYLIILHTAKAVRQHGTQFEVLLKVKQTDNPIFDFMVPETSYYALYTRLKTFDNDLFTEIMTEKVVKVRGPDALSLLGNLYSGDGNDNDNDEETERDREGSVAEEEGKKDADKTTDTCKLEDGNDFDYLESLLRKPRLPAVVAVLAVIVVFRTRPLMSPTAV